MWLPAIKVTFLYDISLPQSHPWIKKEAVGKQEQFERWTHPQSFVIPKEQRSEMLRFEPSKDESQSRAWLEISDLYESTRWSLAAGSRPPSGHALFPDPVLHLAGPEMESWRATLRQTQGWVASLVHKHEHSDTRTGEY